jgi:hypothetical protein
MTSAKPGSPGSFRNRGDAPAGAWIGLSAGFLVGSVFATIGGWWLYDDLTFSDGAVTTRGTVIELVRGGKDGARPKVQYAADDGSVHEIVGSVSSSPPAFDVGEEVTVLYRPEDPAGGRIDSFVERRLFPVIFGGIAAVALLVTGGIALAKWR